MEEEYWKEIKGNTEENVKTALIYVYVKKESNKYTENKINKDKKTWGSKN